MAKAYKLRGEHDRTVVAVIGDGALTGGMAWEALNNIAVARDSRLVIVVNDNGRSYQPTIGGLASHLSSIRVSQRYEHVLDLIKTTVTRHADRGQPAVRRAARREEGPEGLPAAPGALRGPGHQVHRPDRRPRRGDDRARAAPGQRVRRPGPRPRDHPQGLRLRPRRAERGGLPPPGPRHRAASRPPRPRPRRTASAAPKPRQARRGATCSATRWSPSAPAAPTWWRSPPPCCTRSASPRSRPPTRTGSTTSGIAEQHAMTMAAGLAMAGLHPVVSIYATFLNRAFDQLLMDVALHKLPVTVTLDRAGVTGPDGASHNGMWDGSILQVVPGLRVAAPRDGSRIAELLNEAVDGQRRPHRRPLAQGHRRRRGRGGRQARRDGRAGRARARARPGRAAARRRPDGRHLRRGRAAGSATTASA